MEYSLVKHSRKENLTKHNLPKIVEPAIDAVQAIASTRKTLKNREFGERVANVVLTLVKNNKIMSLLRAYDKPV